jgi:hypothetical protein
MTEIQAPKSPNRKWLKRSKRLNSDQILNLPSKKIINKIKKRFNA